MADTAARLVDDVLPRVPVRQWVLSFFYEMRYRLAYDGELVSRVLAVFLRVISRWYRRQAQAMGYDRARCGSVTFRLADEEPVLAALTAASVQGIIATGERAGQRLRRALKDAAAGVRTAPLCFASRGFSLHAATRIAGSDRRGLERLCR